ncbi:MULTISPECIES: aldehyde dehydrogenase [Bacillus]|uniref:Aldehyde dehydrogenase n=2 Tax=Bacillus cereus group TaxID=86661 RepID=A0A2A7DD54_BACAN|nr:MULTISPECIES: aldehyde dehydrogenase [Bacillus]MCP1162647.1 aldehyde dehydrogenase [Bacillus sp. 1813sda1]OTW67910.1 aldehyde dehydrogenase family protein [Bacillus thuringiensis serovar coreanensis]OTX44527.1 aldehyde dehydrogenase family protein [Bacillus thuringiensis serovar sooncheon]OTX53691.1 aldehyde dehydrogenase family protein [Bacillus thuringiensis serovar guiyangiensis]OTX68010.1 aldehyde dehydrogenase family protein [Bacillus thuringiensis serovar roskildiensis]
MSVSSIVNKQKAYFYNGHTRSIEVRKNHLKKLYEGIQRFEEEIFQALKLDLNKSVHESFTTEVGYVLKEISFQLKHISSWSKPKRVRTALTHFGSKGKVVPEPYGVTLIIAPWNYPFQLAIAPLVGALAAGNTIVLKPSELTPNVSKVLTRMLGELFQEELVAVIEGGVEESTALLKEPFDYIFFTGSVGVGKVVMEAAAKQLTPLTLELGGKSPCIVHKDAKIDVTARRIVWGKFLNAGQTCVAPDYMYVHTSVKEQLIEALRHEVEEQYGKEPLHNDSYVRIVSERHFERLCTFLKDGKTVIGGNYKKETLHMEPTVLTNVTWESTVMEDEIFGPILPIIEYDNIEEVIDTIQQHPKPLALYVFSEDKEVQRQVTSNISYGGGCINDVVYHLATPYLPFGGVGSSGLGSYHGEESFRTFSHYKSILAQSTAFDMKIRYSSTKSALKFIRKLLK